MSPPKATKRWLRTALRHLEGIRIGFCFCALSELCRVASKDPRPMLSQLLQAHVPRLLNPGLPLNSSSSPNERRLPPAPQAFVPGSQKVVRRLPQASRTRRTRTLQRTVLVVDDVNDVTDMISLFLKHAGYHVVTAERATEALKIAGEQEFDLIISDIGMPEMNGYELVEALRGMTPYRDTPIIAVTGYTEYDDRGRSLEAGFNAH